MHICGSCLLWLLPAGPVALPNLLSVVLDPVVPAETCLGLPCCHCMSVLLEGCLGDRAAFSVLSGDFSVLEARHLHPSAKSRCAAGPSQMVSEYVSWRLGKLPLKIPQNRHLWKERGPEPEIHVTGSKYQLSL